MNHYHEEEILGKAYDSRLARRLLKYLRPYRRVVAISIVLLIMVSGLRLVGPYLTLVAIDQHIMTGDSAGLTPIGISDQILVLEKGEIVERGTHDDLLKTEGHYATLYERQLLKEELGVE